MSVLTALLPSEIDEKPFDQVLEQLVGELLPVAPVGGAEDAVERVGVGALDLLHGVRERGADVGWRLADVAPVAALGDLEAVDLGEERRVGIAVDLGGLGGLLVPDVADPLEEEQREDVALPVGAIDRGAAQDVGGFPEGGLEGGGGEHGCPAVVGSRLRIARLGAPGASRLFLAPCHPVILLIWALRLVNP